MESTIRSEVVVTWISYVSFDLMMMMLLISCMVRWSLKFKPKIDGCSEEEWTLEEVIICIIYMVV
jgi:hypothetical protein